MTLRSGTDPFTMRLEEVPELVGSEGDLRGLSVDDVRIRPAHGDDGEVIGWVAVIILEHRHGPTAHAVPWILGMRPSKKKARLAAAALLQGLLKGQRKARRDYPGLTDLSLDADRAAMVPVLEQIEQEWHARKELSKPSAEPAAPAPPRRKRAPNAARVPMTPEMSTWAQEAKATRVRWGWSQDKLGQEVGVSGPRVGQFERGECGFPDDVLAKIAEVLDLVPHLASTDA